MMGEFNNFVDNLEKELTCSICYGIFQDPVTLLCLHTFCRECIVRLKETSGDRQLTCAKCREKIDPDLSNLIDSSFEFKSLIDFLHDTRASEQVDQLPKCISCSTNLILVAYCPQCTGMICTNCFISHSKMLVCQDHQAVSLCDFKQEHLNSFIVNQVHCEVKFHEKEKLKYFCRRCQKSICHQCSDTAHSTHEKINIQQKAEEIKLSINKDVVRVNRLKERFEEELELSQQNIIRLENEFDTAKEKVSDHVKVQTDILKGYENATMSALDNMFLEQKTANDEEQSEINIVIQQLDAATDQGKTLQDEKIDHFILRSLLPQRCKELLQRSSVLRSKPNKRNTSFRFVPNTQVTDFMQNLQELGEIIESVPDPSHCSIEVKNDAVRRGIEGEFEIVTRNLQGQVCHTNKGSIDVQIKDDEGCEVENELVESETGKFIVTYKTEKHSPYEILVSIGGKTIKQFPMKVRKSDGKMDFKHVEIFGKQGDKERVHVPWALTVSDSGKVLIIDNYRIVIFDVHGNYLRQFGERGMGDGKFFEPMGVVMYEDRITVADNYPGRIKQFDVYGVYLRTTYKCNRVYLSDMCVSERNIAACYRHRHDDDGDRYGFMLFDKQSGQLVQEILVQGIPLPGSVDLFNYIAYGSNKYFVPQRSRRIIDVFDENGVFLSTFELKGAPDGDNDDIQIGRLAVYGADMLLICDASVIKNRDRVQVFTQEGQFITSFGSCGSDMGQMNCPFDVAVLPNGKVLVLEQGGKRIQVWQ